MFPHGAPLHMGTSELLDVASFISPYNSLDTKECAPHEDWSGRAASCDGYEPVHCPVPKAGLPIPLLFEERSYGRLECGNHVIVPCFLTGPNRHKSCVQKVQRGEENLQMSVSCCILTTGPGGMNSVDAIVSRIAEAVDLGTQRFALSSLVTTGAHT